MGDHRDRRRGLTARIIGRRHVHRAYEPAIVSRHVRALVFRQPIVPATISRCMSLPRASRTRSRSARATTIGLMVPAALSVLTPRTVHDWKLRCRTTPFDFSRAGICFSLWWMIFHPLEKWSASLPLPQRLSLCRTFRLLRPIQRRVNQVLTRPASFDAHGRNERAAAGHIGRTARTALITRHLKFRGDSSRASSDCYIESNR
jgi:hypothetical protein